MGNGQHFCVVCCEVGHAVKLCNAFSAAVPHCCLLFQGRHGKKAKKEEDEDDDDDDAMSSDDEVEEDDNGGEEPPKMHYRCAAAFAAVGH